MTRHQNTEPRLTVFTVNWFSTELIEPLLSNLHEKAENPEEITYLVIDNTNGCDPAISRLHETALPVEVLLNDPKSTTGSVAHAMGLNFAMTKLHTEFALAVDPDVHVFKKNWDTFCINEISANKCSAIGTTYPKWQLGKYHDFTNPVFCLFKTKDFKNITADWTPFTQHRLVTLSDFVKRQLLRCGILINKRKYQACPYVRRWSTFLEPVIGLCSRDTGWRIAQQAVQNNIQAMLFEAVMPDDEAAEHQTPAFTNLAAEFELHYYNGRPILTHKYSTGSIIWRTAKGHNLDFWRQCLQEFETELANLE